MTTHETPPESYQAEDTDTPAQAVARHEAVARARRSEQSFDLTSQERAAGLSEIEAFLGRSALDLG